MFSVLKWPLKVIVIVSITLIAIGFQNCSSNEFNFARSLLEKVDYGVIICDPLASNDHSCEPTNRKYPGLVGELYFLSPSIHGSAFNNGIHTAGLNDYYKFGLKVPATIIMTQINVTTRSWKNSFLTNHGNVVNNDQEPPCLSSFHCSSGEKSIFPQEITNLA